MTFFYLLCFILLVAGVAFLLELTPEGITDDLMKLIAPKQPLRDKVLITRGKKKSRRMTKELLHIREALEATGKANQFTAACCASILLMILGCIFAVMIDNYFMIPVAAVAFAMIPFAVFSATGILKARDLEHINWAVLWMVAGGFALGTALNQTGLATTLINNIPFASWNSIVVMLVGGFICYFLSNFISNSASANLVVPILIVVGKAMAGNPAFENLGGVPAMIAGVAICASLAMCLPVSTPPNALAHSTGMITTKQMATVGIIIGVVGFILGYAMLIFIGF